MLSRRDSGTRWTIDGRGNFWSRYKGFDFDGDGIGDAPHSLVGAFERFEGANPAARLFLQSPSALGLDLAARLSGRAAEDATDTCPLVRPGDHPDSSTAHRVHPLAAGSMLAGFIALAVVMIRGTDPCSR